jgi:hypothetical protein
MLYSGSFSSLNECNRPLAIDLLDVLERGQEIVFGCSDGRHHLITT